MTAIAKINNKKGSKQLRLTRNTSTNGMRKGRMVRWLKRQYKLRRLERLKLQHCSRDKMSLVGVKRRQGRKIRKWKNKPRKAQQQLQFEIVNGRRMRVITKSNGRKIYRAPRKFQEVQGGKLRQQKKAKIRKSDKARVAFRNIARARNDLELRTLRKRRSYLRHKRLNDYLSGKLATPKFLAYHGSENNVSFDRKIDVVANRVAPGVNLRKVRTIAAQGPFAKTNNAGRGTLQKRQLINGYTPNNPGMTAGKQMQLQYEKRKRYAKVRTLPTQRLVGTRIEKLLVNRKSNAIYSKSSLQALSSERLNRWWRHGGKVR